MKTVAALILILMPCASSAQTAPAAQPSAPTFVVRWNNGLSFESPDGNTKLQLGALMQGDGRFALNTPSPITDTFLLRRARIILQGRLAKYFEF